MSVRTAGFAGEIRFMLALATLCSLLMLITRAGIGGRADTSLSAIVAASQICDLVLPEDPSDAVAAFNDVFELRSRGRIQFWQNRQNAHLWLCQARGAGMWAEIELIFAFDRMHRRIIGMRVLAQNETAGLGDRIGEEAFFEQFDDMEASSGVEMKAIRIHGNQFDAVSGATITSRAVETLINRSLLQLDRVASAVIADVQEIRP